MWMAKSVSLWPKLIISNINNMDIRGLQMMTPNPNPYVNNFQIN